MSFYWTTFSFLAALCLGQSCRLHLDPHMEVPDQVFPVRSSNDTQLPGTQLFVVLPLGYEIDSAHQRIAKTPRAYIEYTYEPGTDFTSIEGKIRQDMDSVAKRKHAHYYTVKSFQFGSSHALIYYYPTTVKGRESIALYFGDKSYGAYLSAFFPTNADGARDTLLQTMLSVYRDEDTTEDVTSVQPFTLDVRSTEFAYYRRTNMIYMYTVGGKLDDTQEIQDGFIVFPTVPLKKYPTARERLWGLIKANEKDAGVVVGGAITETTIQGKKAWQIQATLKTHPGGKGAVYAIAIGDPTQPLMLCAFLYHDIDKRLHEVKLIAATLKEKTPAP